MLPNLVIPLLFLAIAVSPVIVCGLVGRAFKPGWMKRVFQRYGPAPLLFWIGCWLTLLVYCGEWDDAHTRTVALAWCADNHFALRSVKRSDADGNPISRRRVWQWERHFRLNPMGKAPAKVIRIGNWFTGALSDTVTVIR